MKRVETVRLDGKCYNFSLVLVNDLLVKQGRWTPEEAIKLASGLSKKVKKLVSGFKIAHELV